MLRRYPNSASRYTYLCTCGHTETVTSDDGNYDSPPLKQECYPICPVCHKRYESIFFNYEMNDTNY